MRPSQTTATEQPRSAPHRPQLTPGIRRLIGVVAGGAVVIASIGFVGSYRAVQRLAAARGFGFFSYVFPVGVDAGIVVLLSLDLVLTFLRIRQPLIRHVAWLLTAATVVFNAAASWPHPLSMSMHAVIPVLFVAVVEAARHAVGRIADITADKHMEGVRLSRWLLAPLPTFRLWRRMKLWEMRSYEAAVEAERRRLVYRALLKHHYGRGWRRTAPAAELLPLRLARYGTPLPNLELPQPEILERYTRPEAQEPAPAEALTAREEPEALAPADSPQPELDAPQQPAQPLSAPDPVGQWEFPEPAPGFAAGPALDESQEPSAVHEEPHFNQPTEWTPPIAPIPHQGIPDDEDSMEWERDMADGQLTGKEGLVRLYGQLTDDQRALPAKQLAETLAPKLGLGVDSCRKYIGDIRAGRLSV